VEPRFRVCLPGSDPAPTGTAERAARLLQMPGSRGLYTVPLPPAKGYAVSAASAVAVALAGVNVTGRKTGVVEALQAAHKAEVLERTGLGDVLAISCGIGLVLRLTPGAPGVGRVECIPLPRSVSVLSLEAEGSMWTGELLADEYLRRGAETAAAALRRVFEERSLEAFAEEATSYTRAMRLARRLFGRATGALDRVPGLIGYYSKKLVTIVMVEADRSLDAAEALSKIGGTRLRLLMPSERGVEVWWDYGA